MYVKQGRPGGGAGAAAGGGILGERTISEARMALIKSWTMLRGTILLDQWRV